jgi:uncharacterized phage-associated protein
MNFPTNPRKVTAAVARLIQKSGADVDYLRISKLIYLADRESILKRGIPIVGGTYFSMRKGPTIGEVMNYVKRRNAPGWKSVISPLRGHALNLIGDPEYASLTAPEIEILDAVVAQHFNRTTDDLVEWCHEHCGEYENVPAARKPIDIETILSKEGRSSGQIQRVAERAKELGELQELLA